MEYEMLYRGSLTRDPNKPELVLVTRDGDPMAKVFVEGKGDSNDPFQGIRHAGNHKYGDGKSALDEKGEGPVALVTLAYGETMDVIPDEIIEGTHVTAVATQEMRKPKAQMLRSSADIAAQNGHLSGLLGNRRVDTAILFPNDPIGVRKDTLGGLFAEKNARAKNIFTPAWFADRSINPNARIVGGKTMDNLEFFMMPDDEELKRLNGILERTNEPTLFIPTCPPDKYIAASSKTIRYSREPLTGGISWAAQNVLDALDQLVPHLVAKGKNPKLVFGLGDYEFWAGYTRGMDLESFMEKTNESAEKIAERVKRMLETATQKDAHVLTLENPQGINTLTITQENSPQVTITGMTTLAGGLDAWNRLVEAGVQQVQESASDPRFNNLRRRVMDSRGDMTKHWVEMKGLEVNNETMAAEFAIDAGFYAAFHGMVKTLYGENGLVVAGDARPMELYGSRLADNLLISVSGMYAGASFNK